MSLQLRERSALEMRQLLARTIRCPDDGVGLKQALAAERIRTLVSSAPNAQLHSLHILGDVRKGLAALFDRPGSQASNTEDDDGYLDTLHRLATTGDIAELGAGRWLAAPLRLVRMNEGTSALVVGAAPATTVGLTFAAGVACAGVARILENPNFNNETVAEALQSPDVWLGPAQPLREWTEKVVDAHRGKLSPTQEVDAGALEIYAPDRYRTQHRPGRWMPASQWTEAPEGVRLFRPLQTSARSYDRPYYLGDFTWRNELILRRTAQVDYRLTRRLRFGLDQLLGVPRIARLTQEASLCTLELGYELPDPEQRVLSLGWAGQDRSRPVLRFHCALRPLIADVLARLMIEVRNDMGRHR